MNDPKLMKLLQTHHNVGHDDRNRMSWQALFRGTSRKGPHVGRKQGEDETQMVAVRSIVFEGIGHVGQDVIHIYSGDFAQDLQLVKGAAEIE
jgi:hypothetical protein